MFRAKVAVQVFIPSMSTVVGLVVPEQSPLQPAKVEPVSAVAVTDAVAPELYVPAPITVPLPVPALLTVSV